MYALKKYVLFIISFLFLQACSGGGGDDTTSGGGSVTPPSSSNSISLDKSSAHFTNGFQRAPTGTVEVNVTFSGYSADDIQLSYASGSTPVDWLDFSESNKTSTSRTIIMDVIDSDDYLPNLYTTTLRVSAGSGADLVFEDIDISMLVTQDVRFTGVIGDTDISPLASTIMTNTSDTWTVSDDAAWASTELTVNSGAITLTTTTIPEELTANSLTGTATLTNERTEETYTIPLEVGLENIYLFADQTILSFVSTANVSNTASTITIANNAGKSVAWEPTADVDWLTFTIIDDNTLTITADVTKVSPNDLSNANVTIAATTEANTNSDIIPVSFFHSGTEIVPFDIDTSGLDINTNAVFVYPTGPYIYAGVENNILKYNQYTGELLETIEVAPAGNVLTNFVIHPKGTTLLAQTNDTTTPFAVHRYKIDLENDTSYELNNSEITSDPTAFTTIAGRYFVVTEALEFANDDLELINNTSHIPFTPSHISIAKDTNTVYAINDADSTINRFSLSVNDATEDKVSILLTASYHPSSLPVDGVISDLAVTSDESNIYIVSDTSEWISFNGQTFTDNGLLDIDRSLLVVNDANEVQGTLYTPDVTDISTHSVQVDGNNQPHYMRTVTFTSDSDDDSFETYTYKYNAQQLTTTAFVERSSIAPVEAPYQLDFTPSNSYVVLFNTELNTIKVTPTPFLLGETLLTHTKNENSLVIFTNNLENISSNWDTYEFINTPWLASEASDSDAQTLTVTLATDSVVTEGFYERDIYIYDKTTQVSGKVTVELTVNAP